MTQDTNTQDQGNEDQNVNIEEYEELLQRSLTESEQEFLQEIKEARDEEQRELSEPLIIQQLDRTAKQRDAENKKAVSTLTGLAGGQSRNGGKN